MGAAAELAILISSQNKAAPGIKAAEQALGALPNVAKAAAGGLGGVVEALGRIGLAGMGLGAIKGVAESLGSSLGVGLASQMEQTMASLNAFTKDTGKSKEILEQIRVEAAKTPFAFQEMATATAALLPVSKASGQGLMDLVKQAEILAASNPMQGLEGASFSLREAMTGDFTSIIERFNLSRQTINKLKEEGVSNFEIIRRAMGEMGFDSDLIAAKAETLEGRWSTFLDTIDNVKLAIAQPIFDALKEGLTTLQEVIDDNAHTIAEWSQGVADAFQAGIRVIKGLGEIARAVFLAFTVDAGGMGLALDKVREVFGDTVADAIQPFVHAFMEAIPAMKEFAGRIKDTLVANLEGAVRFTRALISGDLQGAWNELLQNARRVRDLLGPVLAEWGEKFVAWVQPMAAALMARLSELATQVLGWIRDQVPIVAAALGAWIPSFIGWVGEAIPQLLGRLGDLIVQFLDGIGRGGDEAGEKVGTEWTAAVVDWIGQKAIPALAEALPKILTAIVEFIVRVQKAAFDAALRVGEDIVRGAVQGIQSMLPNLAAKASEMASGALQAARDALGARSPSREFMVLGQDIGEGLELGIVQSIPKVKQATRTMGDSILDEMREIALSIDEAIGDATARFFELGESAGRAINQAIIQADRGIQDAIASASRSIADTLANIDLNRAIRGRRDQFGERQDTEARARSRQREDEDLQRRFKKDLERAKTDEERKAIQERFAEAKSDLQHRRRLEEEDRAFRKHQEQERRAFDDVLESEALQRQLARIESERDGRVKAINDALSEKRKAIEADLVDERKKLLASLEQKMADLKEKFVDKLPPLVGRAEDIVSAFLGRLDGMAAGLVQRFREAVREAERIPREITTVIRRIEEDLSDDYTRAGGGPVSAGRPYLVGERGAELFVPRMAGTVIPNHALAGAGGGGGGVTVVVNVAGSVATERGIAESVRDELLRLGRRNGNIFGGLA